jgi:hypothetical protein
MVELVDVSFSPLVSEPHFVGISLSALCHWIWRSQKKKKKEKVESSKIEINFVQVINKCLNNICKLKQNSVVK